MPSQPLQPLLDDTVAAYAQLVAADDQTQCFANLLDVEQQVAQLTVELGRRLLQTFTEVRRQQAKATPRRCACGRLMEWHAASQWRHGTQFGDLHVSDAYAYCRTCHASARPVHGWLGTGVERWSLAVQEKVVDLAADESCQRAVAKLQRHHPGLVVGRSTALRLLHRHGARAREFVAEKLAAALAVAAQEGRRAGVTELEVEYDGGMIPVATLEPLTSPPLAGTGGRLPQLPINTTGHATCPTSPEPIRHAVA